MNHSPELAPRPIKTADFVEKLRSIRDRLSAGLVEREVAVRLGLLATLAGEHLLLLGPPGTAKSLIARRLHLAFSDSTYFERLLTRFTVPEELFGPLSIKALEEDRYERLTEAYLPKAGIAFLDEIFKANSAILNALLTLLNEREFDNGTTRMKTPLVAVIGASNELPEGGELDALFDRFLLRLHVGPVTKDGFPALLGLRGHESPELPRELQLHARELQTLREVSEHVEISDDVVALLCDLREWCAAESLAVSDRRWRKVVKLLQVSAATNGRSAVSIWDCWLLQHCLWDAPEAREKVYKWYAERVGAAAAMDPSRLTTIVVSLEARLKADQENRSQMRDAEGRHLYVAPDGKLTPSSRAITRKQRGNEPLFLAPESARPQYHLTSPLQDRTKNGAGYTRAELDELYVDDPKEGRDYFRVWSGKERYLADPSNRLKDKSDLPPAMEPTRYNSFYIEGRMSELQALQQDVDAYHAKLRAHLTTLGEQIRVHLWITSEFAEPATRSLQQTLRTVEGLQARLGKLREGFQALPKELPTATPPQGGRTGAK